IAWLSAADICNQSFRAWCHFENPGFFAAGDQGAIRRMPMFTRRYCLSSCSILVAADRSGAKKLSETLTGALLNTTNTFVDRAWNKSNHCSRAASSFAGSEQRRVSPKRTKDAPEDTRLVKLAKAEQAIARFFKVVTSRLRGGASDAPVR